MTFKQLIIFLFLYSTAAYSQKLASLESRAKIELEHENYSNAIKLYTQLLINDPNNILYLQDRAFCFHELKKFSNAIIDCNNAMKLTPNYRNKYYILKIRGSSYFYLEKWQSAFEDLDNYFDMYSDNININLARAYTIYKLERYNEGIESYNSILSDQTITKEQTVEAFSTLGFCYLRLDSISKAYDYYEKIVTLDSLSNDGLYLLAALNTYGNKIEEAVKCYTNILSNDSNDVAAFYSRGIHYASIGNYDLAIRDFKMYILKTNNSGKGMYELALAYSSKKEYNKAINAYMNCLKYDPNSSRIYNQISWTFFLSNKFMEGLKYANKAIALDKENKDAYDTRGCIFYKLKNYNSAIQDFNSALSLDSLYSNAYYYRALCYIKKNEKVNACIDFSMVLQDKNYNIKEGEKPTEILIKENCNN
jgi:tetratricopeptide (TPR) repeat protein